MSRNYGVWVLASDINELITDYSLEEDDIFTETPSSKKMIRT